MASRWQTLALGATSQVKIIRSPLDLVALPKQHLVSSERSPSSESCRAPAYAYPDIDRESVQLALGIRLVAVGFGRPVHHPQHFRAAGLQESPHQHGRENQEGDVEPGRVVPLNGRFHNARVAF